MKKKNDFWYDGININADWFRYRDDTYMIWEHSTDMLHLFLNYINSLHPKIKWTNEIEDNGVLSFLDVLIRRDKKMDYQLPQSTERKPTLIDTCITLLTTP